MSWNERIIDEFRTNSGRVGGPFSGATLLLLHNKGAKTGKERVNPLMYRRDGDRLVIFGSKGGAPKHPDWYWNLLANPVVKVELGTDTVEVRARVARPDERERLWAAQKMQFPMFAQYEARTKREIPVIILEPITEQTPA